MSRSYDDPFGLDAWSAPDDYYEAEQTVVADGHVDSSTAVPPGVSDEEAAAAFAQREQERADNRSALYERLNPEQREAVFMAHESALVLAAAGSGKTSVLTARVARLVSEGEPALPASAVMAVTFTNKASQEMKARLRPLLNKSAINNLWVGTFHSLCNKILRENHAAADLPKSFAILDTDGQESLVRNILKDLGLTKSAVKEARKLAELAKPDLLAAADPLAGAGGGGDSASETEVEDMVFVTPKQCVSYINGRKERNKKPEVITIEVTPNSPDGEQMEVVYTEYEDRLRQQGLLDFQDLLTRAVDLLKGNPEVRASYQDRFRAILVDEFQDTNDIQFEWLELMKGAKCHVTAVGDDDQSIYAFRGADPKNMGKFLKVMAATPKHPKGRLIRLEQNYRSLPHILDAANALIERNSNRLGKVLRTSKSDQGESIDLVTYGNGLFEARSIAAKIYDRIKHDGTQPSEIAVLYRTNMQSRTIEQELNKLGVPLTVYGGFRFYERQEVKNIMAYLDLVADISRDLSFMRVANFPPRGIGERTLEDLRQQAQSERKSMLEMVESRAEQMAINPGSIGNAAAQKKLRQLHAFTSTILDLADTAESMPLSRLIEQIVKSAGIEAHYKEEAAGSKSSEDEARERMENISELISAARQFELENPQLRTATEQLPDYLSFVALMTSTSESDMSKKNTVSLMTVHSSKGLEFDHVYIAGVEEGVFPHARALAEDEERGNGRSLEEGARMVYVNGLPQDEYQGGFDGPGTQEERRLMYVAITRARKTLTISHAMERLNNGEAREAEASRFLMELPDDRLTRIDDRQEPYQPRAEAAASAQSTTEAPRSPSGAHADNEVGGRSLAIIGTAGRDKTRVMDSALWEGMLSDAKKRVKPTDTLVSGGAAWSDHLAVTLFNAGLVKGLQLFLPAPLTETGFTGPDQSAASAANYYHQRFLEQTGVDGLHEIHQAIKNGAQVTCEPPASGYAAMFARNKKVAAASNAVLAYTFGEGQEPEDGGTKNTWEQIRGQRIHVPLGDITHQEVAALVAANLPKAPLRAAPAPSPASSTASNSGASAALKPWQRRISPSNPPVSPTAGLAKVPTVASSGSPTAGQPSNGQSAPAAALRRLNIMSRSGGGTGVRQPSQPRPGPTSSSKQEADPKPAGATLPESARRFLRPAGAVRS